MRVNHDSQKPCAVSIILVNYQRAALTEQCIRSIDASHPEVSYEIIVIDNHSGDGGIEALRSGFPDILIRDSGRNGGFAFANNRGAALARGTYLLFLNNDTEMYPRMLDELYAFLKDHEDIGILGCKAVDGDGVQLPILHRYENVRQIWLQTYLKPLLERIHMQRRLVNRFCQAKSNRGDYCQAEWIPGSAMFMRKRLYEKIGGFDENYFLYMEDEDLCRRMTAAGYEVGIIPLVGYKHYCGGSTNHSPLLAAEYIRSKLLFFYRYRQKPFSLIKLMLYRQIKARGPALTKEQRERIISELDQYISDSIDHDARIIKGLKAQAFSYVNNHITDCGIHSVHFPPHRTQH